MGMKNQCLLAIVLGILWTSHTQTIIYHASLLTHASSGKKVLLLDDAHAQWIERFASEADKVRHNDLYAQQKKRLEQFGTRLVSLDTEKGSRGVVLTETPENVFSCMAEQEIGAASVKDNKETLEILPRAFLRSLTANAPTVDEKLKALTGPGTFKSFNEVPRSFAYALNNGLQWVVADRRRTDLDTYLSLTVYEQWQQIASALEERRSFLWKLKHCFGYCGAGTFAENEVIPGTEIVPTIGYVQRYIEDLHAEFEKHGIVDRYYPILSRALREELAAGNIAATDHFALLYDRLVKDNQAQGKEILAGYMLAFLAQKCDVEFREYADAFESDPQEKYMIVIAGGVHNFDIKSVLESKGYALDKELGIARDPDSEVDFSAILDGAAQKPLELLGDINF